MKDLKKVNPNLVYGKQIVFTCNFFYLVIENTDILGQICIDGVQVVRRYVKVSVFI